jgi:hypothetical protein
MVMNIKAIIASLIVGSSSVAMAAPTVNLSAQGSIDSSYATTVVRNRPAPVDREGRVWRGDHTLPPVYRPVVLASDMRFSGGRSFITVGAQQGRFGTLQITGARGRAFIKQVYVQFANGQVQVIRNLDRTLTANQALTLDLDGNRRGIARIVVYGSPLFNGWRRTAGTFTVTAS